MSISFVEFKKLLNPVIPEKFKLIYEILYYYKIDIEELLSLTTNMVISEINMNGKVQGLMLSSGRFIDLPDDLFDRIVNFLEFNNKPWGSLDTKLVNNEINYVFESNKKGHQYTIPTLYKKFKEHCLKVGIMRDLALGSLINTDVGRYISIMNSELVSHDEHFEISLISLNSDMISSILRFYIVHQNYEEITLYQKYNTDYGRREIFGYSNITINCFSLIGDYEYLENEPDSSIENSNAVFVYGMPTEDTKSSVLNLMTYLFKISKNKFVSFVMDDPHSILQSSVQELLRSELRRWVQYIPLQHSDLQNMGLLNSLEEFLLWILEKFNSTNDQLNNDNSNLTNEFKEKNIFSERK